MSGNVGGMVRRLLTHWAHAPRDVRAQGVAWYAGARAMMRDYARTYGCSVARVSGVVAALSPRLQWGPNLRAARVVLSGGTPTGVFGASLRKAERIMAGERPLAVLSGPKVRAFYRALMGDETAAVIDTWMVKAVGWARKVTERVYERIARALALTAERVGTTTARLQAAVWVAIRGRAS